MASGSPSTEEVISIDRETMKGELLMEVPAFLTALEGRSKGMGKERAQTQGQEEVAADPGTSGKPVRNAQVDFRW